MRSGGMDVIQFYTLKCSMFLIIVLCNGLIINRAFGSTKDSKRDLNIEPDENEKKLINLLFHDEDRNYQSGFLPIKNLNDSIQVNFILSLVSILNVDEKSQILKLNLWLRLIWTDYNLKWETHEFGGIETVNVPANMVWKPDLVLFNNADGAYTVSWEAKVVVGHTGDMLWVPPAIYSSSCIINVKYFPFDEQHCELKFGSWTYSSNEIWLNWYEGNSKLDTGDFEKSNSWRIIDCTGEIVNITRAGRPPTSQIVYNISIRRRAQFYIVIILMPCLLVATLTVCVFYLPTNAPAKVTLAINILLSMLFFLLLLSKMLPPTDIIPLISRFSLFTFCLNMVSIVNTIVIINISARTPRSYKLAPWMKNVFINILPRMLLMHQPSYIRESKEKAKKKNKVVNDVIKQYSTSNENLNDKLNYFLNMRSNNSIDHRFPTTDEVNNKDRNNTTSAESSPIVNKHHLRCYENDEALFKRYPVLWNKLEGMRNSFDAIKYISANIEAKEAYSEVSDDWIYIGTVIDRFLLYIFAFVMIVGTLQIFISRPDIFDSTPDFS